jgi:GMP synthase (glutamine-hydrolysing)
MGICYGLQEIARTHGGNVEAHSHREYGYAKISVEKSGIEHADALFQGIVMEEDGGLQVTTLTALDLRNS